MLYVEQIININGTQASDTLEWCSNCDPTLDIFFKYLQKENNIIQKSSYTLEDSAAAQDLKHGKSQPKIHNT